MTDNDVLTFLEKIEEISGEIKEKLYYEQPIGYDLLKINQLIINFRNNSDDEWWKRQLRPGND